jgi:hypothetical protein
MFGPMTEDEAYQAVHVGAQDAAERFKAAMGAAAPSTARH